MSRQRMIHPCFWEDEDVASWPLATRLTYIALWSHADDTGVVKVDPTYLHFKCFPYDTDINMKAAILPLVNSGRLMLYEAKGEHWGKIKSFLKWQKINRPSKWHNPTKDEGSLITHDELREDRFFRPLLHHEAVLPVPADTKDDFVVKPTDCDATSDDSVSPPEPLTVKLNEVKLKQPLPTVEVVKSRAREEQPQPLEIIHGGIMSSLEKQWEPGSEAEKAVKGWWKYYNHLGSQGNPRWRHREFGAYRSQLLRVAMTGADDKHMRLAIRYLHDCGDRRYMKNGDDLYQHPATLFGKDSDSFEDVQRRIDTIIVQAVQWDDARSDKQAQKDKQAFEKQAEEDRNKAKAAAGLRWLEANQKRAYELCLAQVPKRSLNSEAMAATMLKRWRDECKDAVESGSWISTQEWVVSNNESLRKEIEGEKEAGEETKKSAHQAGV